MQLSTCVNERKGGKGREEAGRVLSGGSEALFMLCCELVHTDHGIIVKVKGGDDDERTNNDDDERSSDVK